MGGRVEEVDDELGGRALGRVLGEAVLDQCHEVGRGVTRQRWWRVLHVGQGRLLPTTSVDEYSATLARWFGVSDSEMPQIAPNIGRFANRNLGFLG